MALLDQGLDIADIEKIDLIMPDDRLTIVDNRDMPDVCLQHMVAVTLIDGGASFDAPIEAFTLAVPGLLH